jgi:hypothetical protein
MIDDYLDIEALWGDLLSQEVVRIQTTFNRLLPAEQEKILRHLRRMASDSDWQPNQRIAAQTALQILIPGH